MKDAYSFDRDKAAALKSYDIMFAAYKRIFDRLAAIPPRGGGRHRGHRRRCVARVPGDCRHRRRRHRPTAPPASTPPTSSWPRACCRPGKAAAGGRGHGQGAHAGQEHLCQRGRAARCCHAPSSPWCWPPTSWTKPVPCGAAGLACCWCAATMSSTRKAGKVEGLKNGWRFRHRGRDRDSLRLQARLPGPDRPEVAGEDRRRPHRGAPWPTSSAAPTKRLPHRGINWGRDLPEPDPGGDIRNVVAGDPSPDGQGALAIQRGIEVGHVFLPARHQVLFRDERHLPGRDRQSRS